MNPNNQPAPLQQAQSSSPVSDASTTSSRKVIQPLSDMSEYVNSAPAVPQQRPVVTQSVPLGTATSYQNDGQLPTATNGLSPRQLQPVHSPRVAALVPSLRVYAGLAILVGVLSLLSFSSIFLMQGRQLGGRLSGLALAVFGVVAVSFCINGYLLLSRNAKAVSTLLTVMLVLGGLGLLGSIMSIVRVISHINLSTIVSLMISIGMLAFLYDVKNKVDLVDIK